MTADTDRDATGTADTLPEDDLAAELENLRAALSEAETRAEESRNALLRAVAEAENARKRAQRDVEAAHRFGTERLAADLLEVFDSLELGIAAGADASAQKLVEGMDATQRLLVKALERAGVAVVDPQGAAVQPGAARSHDDPGIHGGRPRHRARGDPEGLHAERTVAAPGPRHRGPCPRGGVLNRRS